MNRVNKTLLAKLITHFIETAQMKDNFLHLPEFLPDELKPMEATRRFQFLTNFAFWYQQNVDSQASFEDILQREDLSFWDVLTYLREQLLEFDADAPFEPPTIPQVAWVFERLNASQGSFRSLIYGEMGFDESAYTPLLLAGGMNITNAMFREYNQNGETASEAIQADLEAQAKEEAYVADPRSRASFALQYLLRAQTTMPDTERMYWLAMFNQVYKEITEEKLRVAFRNSLTPEAQAQADRLDAQFKVWYAEQEKEEREGDHAA